MGIRSPAFWGAAATLLCAAVFAQPVAQPIAPDERIVLDGRLDEPAWGRAAEFERFIQFHPIDGQPPPPGTPTGVRVLIGDDALVFGFRAVDPQPSQIRAPLVRRDKVLRDQDFVAVVIDAAGTGRSAQFVRVNAAGVLADGMYLYDGDVEDFAPDFDIEAAAQRTAQGYDVELRIPLLALRYPFEGGEAWRLMFTRNIPREQGVLLLSVPLSRDTPAFIAGLEPLAGLDGVVERIREQPLITVKPELTWRQTRGQADGVPAARERKASLGAEIKWRPRADWVIDATINPDFSQVELDAPQLAGNTRFALSVPEKRAFFLESSDVLDLPLPAFYSRAITDPRAGVRATWRGPDRDASALVMIDDGGGLLLRPGPYATRLLLQDARAQLGLVRSRWHDDGLTTGALLSWREDDAGFRNAVVGADVYARTGEADEWRARGMLSRTEDPALDDAPSRSQSGAYLQAQWNRLTPDWRIEAIVERIAPGFRNDNGFVEQAGVTLVETEVIRRLGQRQWGAFVADEFELFLWGQHVRTLGDATAGIEGGQTVASRLHPGIWWAGPRNAEASAKAEIETERARAGGRLHQTPRLAADYGFNPASWMPRLALEVEWGRFLDVEADRVDLGARGLAQLRLRGSLGAIGFESDQRIESSVIRGRHGGRALTETAWQWIGVMHMNAQDSLRLVWQGTDIDRARDRTAGMAAFSDRSRSISAVFQHRLGIRHSFSAGWIRETGEPGGRRDTEVFAKAAMAW
jgi:Domain of unknown function (DUF5916)